MLLRNEWTQEAWNRNCVFLHLPCLRPTVWPWTNPFAFSECAVIDPYGLFTPWQPMTHWVTRHNQIHSGRTWTYLAILQFRVFLLREERLSETNGWIMVVPMEFSSMPLWFFSACDPSLGWDLYNHPEHQLWFWAAMGHFQSYYPGPLHWAWLIVDALEVLLTDSCLCLESCSLISSPCPLP